MTASFPTTVWDGDTADQLQSKHQDKTPSFRDWDRIVEEVIATQNAVITGTPSTAGNGAVAGTGNVVEEQLGAVHQTTITLDEFSMLVASAAVGFVGTKIYDFPAGLIRILGAVMDLTITTDGEGTAIDDDALLSVSVGSATAADDGTLTSTEANIIQQTDYQLSGGTLQKTGLGVADAWLDGITSGAADALLNIVCPDADRTDVDEAVTVTGTIKITWTNLGDT